MTAARCQSVPELNAAEEGGRRSGKGRFSLESSSASPTPMQVLLVEDDLVLADGLARYLSTEGMAVEVVHGGTLADSVLQHRHFEAMLLDIGLPGLDGLAVLRRLRARGSAMPVILLTARDGVKERVNGLELGADDYIVKPFEPAELGARIRAVVRRAGAFDGKLEAGGITMDLFAKRVYLNHSPLQVSAREWSILECLMRNTGRVVSKQKILDAILDCGQEISENAVEVYVCRLRAKTNDAKIRIRTIRGFGYLMERSGGC